MSQMTASRKSVGRVASVVLMLGSILLALAAGELVLRLKNSSMTTYDIEMWRYAKELKVRSADPALDFEHATARTAVLQNVSIRLNDYGLRGGPVPPRAAGGRRILVLGGSIALGWGVAEDKTVEARLEKSLRDAGEDAVVLNGGVGNYNADRYVSRFFKDLYRLDPTDILVLYFLRDAEILPPGNGNWLLRHSELAVTLWAAYHRVTDRAGEQSLVDHYRSAYQPGSPGFETMQAKLKALADYGKAHGIRLYLAMTPDVHNLTDYKFGFAHDAMRRIAEADGFTYVDLLPIMRGRPAETLFAMPGDPHPNALGHQLMADAILPILHK
jgi:hypothetical protein